MKNFLAKNKWFDQLLVWSPVAIWASYLPNIHFGHLSGMNFELSISLIFVAILAAAALPVVATSWRKLLTNRAVVLAAVFVGWNFLSIIWSVNKFRSFMTAGVWLTLWLVFAAAIMTKNWQEIWSKLKKNLIASSVIMSFLAIIQVVYGAFFDWGLCAGCLARGFGFVRPSGLAIEPQFFGSLLIAPIFVLVNDAINHKKQAYWKLAINCVALYLTLSRGAIFAVGLAIIVLIMYIKKIGWRNLAKISLIIAFGFSVGMVWHAIFTEVNPRISDGFGDSIAKSVNQMTLGKISIRLPSGKIFKAKPSFSQPKQAVKPESSPQKAIFDGYVEKSTNERAILNNLALKTWRSDWRTTLFGVGAGGAGRAVFALNPEIGWDFEIIQNEFLSILLELGLVGLSLFLAIVLSIFLANKSNPISLAILVAYIIQWNFFSGLPNAIHIYLVLAVMFILSKKSNQKLISAEK